MRDGEIEALREALEAQRALQREADHRVKNALQLISSLVMLQGRRASEPAAREALKAVQQRVTAISAAHRHVSRDEGAERVELSALLRELAADLAGSAGREGVRIELDLEAVEVPARDAAPLALIFTEALSNALRHAFPDGRDGAVHLALRRCDGQLRLLVADDGEGMPAPAPKGFGTTMIQLLAQQLHADLETAPAQPGLRLSVSVPMDHASPGH